MRLAHVYDHRHLFGEILVDDPIPAVIDDTQDPIVNRKRDRKRQSIADEFLDDPGPIQKFARRLRISPRQATGTQFDATEISHDDDQHVGKVFARHRLINRPSGCAGRFTVIAVFEYLSADADHICEAMMRRGMFPLANIVQDFHRFRLGFRVMTQSDKPRPFYLDFVGGFPRQSEKAVNYSFGHSFRSYQRIDNHLIIVYRRNRDSAVFGQLFVMMSAFVDHHKEQFAQLMTAQGGVECSHRIFGYFADNDCLRQTDDKPVSGHKPPAGHRRIGKIFADKSARFGDLAGQLLVFGGVNPVESRREHGVRSAFLLECPDVPGSIYSSGQSPDNGDFSARKASAQFDGVGDSLGRNVLRSDNGGSLLVGSGQFPSIKEHQWWIIEFVERLRVIFIEAGDQMCIALPQFIYDGLSFIQMSMRLGDHARPLRPDAGKFLKIMLLLRQNSVHLPIRCHENIERSGAYLSGHLQSQNLGRRRISGKVTHGCNLRKLLIARNKQTGILYHIKEGGISGNAGKRQENCCLQRSIWYICEMKKVLIFCLIAVPLSMLAISCGGDASLDARLAKARRLVNHEKYADALEQIQPLIPQNPTNSELLMLTAETFMGLKQYDSAHYYAKQYTALFPTHLEGYRILYQASGPIKNYDDQIFSVSQLGYLEHNRRKYHLDIAELNFLRGEYGMAIRTCNQIFEYDPGNTKAMFILANSLASIGKVDSAITIMETLDHNNPDQVEIISNLASYLVSKRDYDRAAVQFRRLTSMYPDYMPGWYGLGNVLLHQADTAGARKAYMEVYSRDSTFLRVDSILRAITPMQY
jgi:Flp pilus assembly protein TadD